MPKINRNLLNLLASSLLLMACQSSENPLDQIMASKAKAIKNITQNLEKHEVQILYTQIDRDAEGQPVFTEYDFQLDDAHYFYPASTAKFPTAVLAMQKVNELQDRLPGLNLETPLKIIQRSTGNLVMEKDTTQEAGVPTLGHMVKKVFLVSDNDAYNFLYHFAGRNYINAELDKRNMGSAQLNHTFGTSIRAATPGPYDFESDRGSVSTQSEGDTKIKYNLERLIKGRGYTDNEGQLTEAPMDFSEKNFFSIRSLNKVLKAIIFPETLPESERFGLTDEDYEFLRFWMSRNALESEYPNYNDGEHWDSYVKYFMYGDSQAPMPKHIRIYNKVGQAYGTSTDVAYIHDEQNNIEFMLVATVLTNENGIFNDGVYEYDELGVPFLAELGRQVYQYELDRK